MNKSAKNADAVGTIDSSNDSMLSEAASKADFSGVRYAQCWEDTEIVVAGMNIKPGDVCVSIASAGDNTLALLTKDPARVVALDLSIAQLACLDLRMAAFKKLSYGELLMLIGALPSTERYSLFDRCRSELSATTNEFWQRNRAGIEMGIAHYGKFERYFKIFRTVVLPAVQSRDNVQALLQGGDRERRRKFFKHRWNTWRWRALFRMFFSKSVMGRLGRDPAFFDYVNESISSYLLRSTEYALTELNPAENPYLHWILEGQFGRVLPVYLQPENFAKIRDNINRIEIRRESLEEFLDQAGPGTVNSYNLSDVFEYMSQQNYENLLRKMVSSAANNARLVYWNMMVPRKRPESMHEELQSMDELAAELFSRNKTFFYRNFVIEEVRK